jgi:hypothetical protein
VAPSGLMPVEGATQAPELDKENGNGEEKKQKED